MRTGRLDQSPSNYLIITLVPLITFIPITFLNTLVPLIILKPITNIITIVPLILLIFPSVPLNQVHSQFHYNSCSHSHSPLTLTLLLISHLLSPSISLGSYFHSPLTLPVSIHSHSPQMLTLFSLSLSFHSHYNSFHSSATSPASNVTIFLPSLTTIKVFSVWLD